MTTYIDVSARREAYDERLEQARIAFDDAIEQCRRAEVAMNFAQPGPQRDRASEALVAARDHLRSARLRYEDGEAGRWRVRELPGGGFEIEEGPR
jgi:hypothetical protein